MSDKDKKDAVETLETVADDISVLEQRYQSIFGEEKKERKEKKEESEESVEELEQRFKSLLEKEPKITKKYYTEETKRIQSKTDKLELSMEMEELTSEIIENVKPIIENEKRRVKKENIESKFLLIQEQQQQINTQLLKHMEEQRQELKELRKQQEYLNRAARKTLGEEYYIEQFYRLTQGGIKTIVKESLLAPFKMINIIVLRPARYAFWNTVGKWGYLLWGLLMLFMLLCITIQSYRYMNANFPEYMGSLINMITYYSGLLSEQGSIIGNYILNMMGDTIKNVVQGAYEGISEIFSNTVEMIKDLIFSSLTSIIKDIKNAINPFKLFG